MCALAAALFGCGGGGGPHAGGGTTAGGSAGGPTFSEIEVGGGNPATYGGNCAVVAGQNVSGGKLVSFDLTDVDGNKATVPVSPALPSGEGGYGPPDIYGKLVLLKGDSTDGTYLGSTGELVGDNDTTFAIAADGSYVWASRWDSINRTDRLFSVNGQDGTLGAPIDATGKGTLKYMAGGKALFQDEDGGGMSLYGLPGMGLIARYPQLGTGYGAYGGAAFSGGGVAVATAESWSSGEGGGPVNPPKVVYFAPGSAVPKTLYEAKVSGSADLDIAIRGYDEAMGKLLFTVFRNGNLDKAYCCDLRTGNVSSLSHDYVWKPGLLQAYRWSDDHKWLARVSW